VDDVGTGGAEVEVVTAVVAGGDVGPGPVDRSSQLEKNRRDNSNPAFVLMFISSDVVILGHVSSRC
jgi:hypothetical protein